MKQMAAGRRGKRKNANPTEGTKDYQTYIQYKQANKIKGKANSYFLHQAHHI